MENQLIEGVAMVAIKPPEADDHGYALDLIYDMAEHLSIELAVNVTPEALEGVAPVIQSISRCIDYLELNDRPVPDNAIEIVAEYRHRVQKRTN